jgi:SAM-dependent methyltransferase
MCYRIGKDGYDGQLSLAAAGRAERAEPAAAAGTLKGKPRQGDGGRQCGGPVFRPGVAVQTTEGPLAGVAQEEFNGRLYRRPGLVREYRAVSLCPAEATVLVRYRDDVQRRRVLDLGCGTGRLAAYLRPLTDRYAGLDVSPYMVAHCRGKFAGLPFFQGDMRSLTPFAAGSFDAVFAVFNLLDAVSHPDRLRVLAEIRRVLSAGGLLAFSSHNRNYARAAEGPRLGLSRNPLTQLRYLADYLRACANHRRVKAHQRFEPDYALLNDCAHGHAVLHYYIAREAQARQLAAAGFRLVECLDEWGRTLGPGDEDSASASLHYVARPSG